ncbi:holo-ACP synthase [Oscillochloris sp. ZM17-4]|uniref:holo-ACP synthase n=1 Tax=Oscillochloris sp. ZM17-4 TaxID=2866714 RepID=UPI001C73CBFE|nr:holo-ACP synthase [Oscillochloris sp. ZM17-4]MBX0326179.1 holo-ACP synthase [Oscillochloris sp. ZM17-4]
MIYHGIDIVEIARIERAAARWGERFLRRVYTEGELGDCAALGPAPRYQSLAARWAAKEAAAKALGLGLSGMAAGAGPNDRPGLTDIEVVRAADGQPSLRLHGPAAAAADALGLTQIALSMSHSGGSAIASVVAMSASAE